MSRMEAGKLELENKPFNIYHLEPQLNNIFKETIEKKDVMFKIEYFDFDVKYFVGDELRIMQILVNLLSNASKFTEKGEIKVTFRQMYKEDQVANIMMRVHDTGKGMSREFLSHIFRPFEQEGVEISKKYGGSGLGMAITDQLVKLMGGEIVVDSLEGKGSDFTVFLNLPISTNQQYEDEKEVVVEEFSFDQKRILLAEDNDINAEICLSVLNAKGAFVERVENGQVAVETFKKHAEHYYDLILMDIQMPEMNGYEATQAIRSLNREDSQSIPIFALSADAYDQFIQTLKDNRNIMNGSFKNMIDSIISLDIDLSSLYKTIVNNWQTLFHSGFSILSNTLSSLYTFFIGLVFSIYLLFSKETLSKQIKTTSQVLIGQEKTQKICNIIQLSSHTFSNFITCQCLEACILGSMFVISMSILQMPYALLMGVVIAVTALIPVFGAFIGCFVGIIMIGIVNPLQALEFIVLFLVLQQIEGNLIYPHVVGNSVGLPSIWVFVAVIIGGNLMGILGMFLFIPLTSILYTLFKEYIKAKGDNRS